ncbi:MAG: ATP-binding protein [Candidatus Aminicenantes bacterium]|nr:ATP-binding protein [Candidatus Aminicenantes bacterium]
MNPFKYGTVVADRYFIDREKEIAQIKDDLLNGINIILYAPRRFGKTSLVMQILSDLKESRVKTVYLDLFQVYSLESFIRLYASKVMEASGFSMKKAIKSLKSCIRGVIPSMGLDDDGKPVLSFSYDSKIPKEYSLLDVLDLPKKLKGKNERWVIVFDEFQEINRLDGEMIEKQFRSIFQFHNEIAYIFMGSKTHLMLNMFADKRRAFYNIGKLKKIDKISAQEMIAHMESEFKKGGFSFSRGIFEKVLSYTDNIPYYNQYLASQIWQSVKEEGREIDDKLVEKAVIQILDNQGDYYYTLLNQLTVYQRSVLHAFIREQENIYSKEYTQKHGLSSVSSTQRALKRLLELEIIEKIEDKYVFSDPFFPLYLQQRTFA